MFESIKIPKAQPDSLVEEFNIPIKIRLKKFTENSMYIVKLEGT